MLPFLCFRCFHVSNSAEGLRCLRCEGDGSGTVMAANSYSAIPESGNASPGYYVTVEDASSQVFEEDLVPLETTREASTQVSEEDLVVPAEPTREAITQTTDTDLPLQIAGSHGYEYCLKSAGPSQNQASHDFDQNTNANQNGLTDSNTNEGELQNQSYDISNAANLLEVMDDTPATSQKTYICEQSSLGENENSFDELLRRQGLNEPIERGIKSNSFAFKDSIPLESKYPAENLLSDTTEKVEDRQDKGSIPPPFSFCPRGNGSMNKCLQENSVTAISVAEHTPQASNKFSKGRCEKCGKFFFKASTFYAHFQGNCNMGKYFKCNECGELFTDMSYLLLHRRVHTGEKPFKCTQCDYASKWPHGLKTHLEKHTNIPPSISSISRKKTPVNKYLKKNLLKSKTVKQKKPRTSLKLKIMRCKKCSRFFSKISSFISHVQNDCNPNP